MTGAASVAEPVQDRGTGTKQPDGAEQYSASGTEAG